VQPRSLFSRLFFSGLSKAHTGATAILVDELDAGLRHAAVLATEKHMPRIGKS
jgi:hypothetical protein